jgi:hypothetical protein
MDEQAQTRAINIPTMDEQTEKGNQYTYDGRIVRQGQSIYPRWIPDEQTDMDNQYTYDGQTDKSNQYTYDGQTDRQGQSIYL